MAGSLVGIGAAAATPLLSRAPAVLLASGESLSLFAARDLPRNFILYTLEGPLLEQPSRHSIQVGAREHMGASGKPYDELLHSCTPNVRVRTGDLTLRALRGIQAGDELFLNYLATEATLAAPFECGCRARWCPGLIAGYGVLTPWQKQAIAHITARHLREG